MPRFTFKNLALFSLSENLMLHYSKLMVYFKFNSRFTSETALAASAA